MNKRHFVSFSCFLSAVMGSSFQNIESDSIDRSVRLGQFIDIQPGVVIEAHSKVDSFAHIAANTHIGGNSRVGSYANVGESCKIANNVYVGPFSKVANQVAIGSDSSLDDHTEVSSDVKIGNNAKLGKFSSVGSNGEIGNGVNLDQYAAVGINARIRDDCVLDKFSAVGVNAELSKRAYLGQYSHISPYVTVGESAVIHNFVEIEKGKNVKPKQVVIRTPSSFDLYQRCELDVPTEKAKTADRRTNEAASPEFNSMLRQMIETELNTLRTNCGQDGIGPTKPKTLPEIISLYLIHYHGLQRFNEIKQQFGPFKGLYSVDMINGNIYINGNSYTHMDSSLLQQLQHEYHFENSSPNNVLEPDVKHKFIQLLAIDQDVRRHQRVRLDTFCQMLQEILSGDRDVICVMHVLESRAITF